MEVIRICVTIVEEPTTEKTKETARTNVQSALMSTCLRSKPMPVSESRHVFNVTQKNELKHNESLTVLTSLHVAQHLEWNSRFRVPSF